MASRIPPTLIPYIAIPPQGSLELVTSVLGASANWVILRYLFAALNNARDKSGPRTARYAASDEAQMSQIAPYETDGTSVAVVLVSWMRDLEFWKSEARRAVGLDLARLQQEGRFIFVDGLTNLFTPSPETSPAGLPVQVPPASAPQSRTTAIPLRGIPPTYRPFPTTTASLATQAPSKPSSTKTPLTLHDASLTHLLSTISAALLTLPAQKTILILDTPTLLLTTSPTITSASLTQTLLRIRSLASVHATILHVPSDAPFLSAAAESLRAASDEDNTASGGSGAVGAHYTPMDTETSAFVVGVAHQARLVLGVRRLGTGWAGDVSGVVRVTRGGGSQGEEDDGDGLRREDVEEGEWLYHIGGDGGIKVWARGAGME